MDVCSVTSHRRFKIDQSKCKERTKPSDGAQDLEFSEEKVFTSNDRTKAVRRIRVSRRRKNSEKFVYSYSIAGSTVNKSEFSEIFIV